MIVPTGIDILELAGFGVPPLSVNTLKKEPFNFVGSVERVTVLLMLFKGKGFEHAADIGGVDRSALVDDLAEHDYFARSEKVGRNPVKRAPVDPQPQVAFPLSGKSTDRRAVKSQVVPALDDEFLVVVEHVQTAFQVAEKNGDGLDAFLVGEILDPFLPDLVLRNTILPLLFSLQVHFFERFIREREKTAQIGRHGSPLEWILRSLPPRWAAADQNQDIACRYPVSCRNHAEAFLPPNQMPGRLVMQPAVTRLAPGVESPTRRMALELVSATGWKRLCWWRRY